MQVKRLSKRCCPVITFRSLGFLVLVQRGGGLCQAPQPSASAPHRPRSIKTQDARSRNAWGHNRYAGLWWALVRQWVQGGFMRMLDAICGSSDRFSRLRVSKVVTRQGSTALPGFTTCTSMTPRETFFYRRSKQVTG